MVIHGIGEQWPMETIAEFVQAVWETDPDVSRNGKPFPSETWSRPDVRTGSLELRRTTTRESTTTAFPRGVRSDFYELYWADLSAGSTWEQVEAWVMGLLFRNPKTAVPPDDLINYFWARRAAGRTFATGAEDFEALRRLEEAVARLDKQEAPETIAAFRRAQRTLSEHLRRRPKPETNEADTRWLITDLVTLGSPLTHAEFLLAKNVDELKVKIAQREFPTCPPVRELLDPASIDAARGGRPSG